MFYLDKTRGVAGSNIVRRTGKFDYPLMKNRDGSYKIQSGERVRVNMTSDTFLPEADAWRDEMWSIIKKRSDVLFWLLTKRPERIIGSLPSDWGSGYENVVLNVTCENQEMFEKRYRCLIDIPARHKGLCVAPILSHMDITKLLSSCFIDEVECGGENYGNPRPVQFEWVKALSEQCNSYQINFSWYESGTKLYKDGQLYEFKSKGDQTIAAFFSGLNLHFNDIEYKLFDADKNRVGIREKMYNKNHCMFCANGLFCNGCSGCGDCGSVCLVTQDELIDEEVRIMNGYVIE